MSEPEVQAQATCYRHPDRAALTSCSRCERPICGEDLVEAPVGYQCPECAKGGQPVRTARDLAAAPATRVIVGLIVVGFVLGGGGIRTQLAADGALVPALVGQGEVWRLVTSGFLHVNLIHIGFNGYLLWLLGHQLEPGLGRARYLTLYAGGLMGGGLGVILLGYLTVVTPLGAIPVVGSVLGANPFAPTVGASGAVFGLMGAAMVGLRKRGIDPWRTDIGSLVLLNLVLTFVIANISVGGHLGGLAGGALVGSVLLRDRERSSLLTAVVITAAMAVAAIALATLTLR